MTIKHSTKYTTYINVGLILFHDNCINLHVIILFIPLKDHGINIVIPWSFNFAIEMLEKIPWDKYCYSMVYQMLLSIDSNRLYIFSCLLWGI